MSGAKVDLESVLNAANDYYSLAGTGGSAGTSANNGLAAIVGGTAGQTISLSNSGPLDSRKFDVTAYTAEVLQHTTIRGLYEQDTALRQEIRSLDGFLQDLVYKNYSKFINATDTIRKMRDNVVDIDTKLRALSSNVDDITTVNQTISNNLESHRSKIQDMLVRNAMLQKIKFLVDLPASMERGLREGRYSDVVAEWIKGDAMLTAVLKRHTNVASFSRTQSECRKIALAVYEKLTNIIKSGGGMAPVVSSAASKQSAPNTPRSKGGSKSASASTPQPIVPSPISSSIDAEDAAMIVRLAFADLKALVPTSIFTDANRPANIESEVISMQTTQCESLLNANIDVAVATVVTDLQEAVAVAVANGGSPSITTSATAATTTTTTTSSSSTAATTAGANAVSYETCAIRLSAINTDMLQQSLKFSYAKYASSVNNLRGMIAASLELERGSTTTMGSGRAQTSARAAGPPTESAVMEEISMRVTSTTKSSLVRVVDTLFPAVRNAATTLIKYVIRNQHTITDSHRSAADVARVIQNVCEETFAAITSLLNSLSRGLKVLSERFLNPNNSPSNSSHTAMCVMIDDGANSVLQGVLGTLTAVVENPAGNGRATPTPAPTTGSPFATIGKGADSGYLWIVAHNSLVAAYIAKHFVNYSVEGYGDMTVSATSSSALQGAFASLTKKLVANFIMLAGQHASSVLQTEYLGGPDPSDISGPHRVFQLVFGQWAGLHTECLAWFPDGQGRIAYNKAGVRHERSNSVGSNSSSQQSARPSLGSHGAGSSARGGATTGLFSIPAAATFLIEGGTSASTSGSGGTSSSVSNANNTNSKFGGGTRRLAIVPSTIDARHIQEAVIINTLLTLEELVRIVHFTRAQFNQLQVDLSFVLQQTGPNSPYWLRDEPLFVNIVNAIASSAYRRIIGSDKTPLTQGMVEKLARKDD